MHRRGNQGGVSAVYISIHFHNKLEYRVRVSFANWLAWLLGGPSMLLLKFRPAAMPPPKPRVVHRDELPLATRCPNGWHTEPIWFNFIEPLDDAGVTDRFRLERWQSVARGWEQSRSGPMETTSCLTCFERGITCVHSPEA